MKFPVRKLGIVLSSEASDWASCRTISSNLQAAYRRMAKNSRLRVEWIHLSGKAVKRDCRSGSGYLWEMAERIVTGGFTDLVFLDHHVEALPLLLALKLRDPALSQRLRYCFHVYGDFALFSDRWSALSRELEGAKVKLLCPSERHGKLVSSFLRGSSHSGNVAICPFPLQTREFRFSPGLRREMRKKLGLKEEDILLLYAGRICLHKGVQRLIEEFALQTKSGKAPGLRLAIVGNFDDSTGWIDGIRVPAGYSFAELKRLLASLPPSARNKILLAGSASSREMRGWYCAADLFVSLSLFRGEDYGMAPAEALCSGLPAVLSDWGGYAAFAADAAPASCRLVAVSSKGSRGVILSSSSLSETLRQAIRDLGSFRQETRTREGEKFARRVEVANVAEKLEDLLSPSSFRSFTGFRTLNGTLRKEIHRHYVRAS